MNACQRLTTNEAMQISEKGRSMNASKRGTALHGAKGFWGR